MVETQSRSADRPTTSLSTLEKGIVVLVGITAVTHIYPGVVEGAPPLVLAGLGFLGGAALYVRGVRRDALAIAAIPYTAIQIPLWVVIKAGNYTLVATSTRPSRWSLSSRCSSLSSDDTATDWSSCPLAAMVVSFV